MFSKRDLIYVLCVTALVLPIKYLLGLEMQSLLIGMLLGAGTLVGFVLWKQHSDELLTGRLDRVRSVYSQYKSRPTIMLSTDRGVDRIETAARAVPESIWQSYSGVASGMMYVWWVCWGGFGLYGLWRILTTEPESTTSAASSSSGSLTVSPVDWLLAVPEVVLELLMQVAIAIPLYWAIMLVFIPSLLLHEFGHVVGFVRAGFDLDEYGVIFWGPLPVAAFVRPSGRMEETTRNDYQRAVSSGPMAHVIFASLYVAIGIGVAAVFASTAARILSVAAVGLALMELLLGAMNAIPISGLDGQHFLRAWRSRDADWRPPRTESHRAAEGFGSDTAQGVIA
jgi:Zn-dependent protease